MNPDFQQTEINRSAKSRCPLSPSPMDVVITTHALLDFDQWITSSLQLLVESNREFQSPNSSRTFLGSLGGALP